MKTHPRNFRILGGLVVVMACVLNLSAASTLPVSRRGIVALVIGDVRVDGKKADLGQELGAVVLVQTGPGSRCDIVFGGSNALSISQNAVVRFDFSAPTIAVKLDRGGVTSVLKKLDKLADKSSFDIRTQQTLAGVRGTSFCVWCDQDSTYVCACNGKVHTEDFAGSNKLDLAAAHHTARLYTSRNGAIEVSEAGILHHNDDTVETTAKAIGYKVDWTKIDD